MPDTFVLILERPPGSKDLFDFINDQEALHETLARDFMRQVLDAILACHQRGVIHRDIKDENILVTMCPNSKLPKVHLIDFGSGAHIRNDIYFDFDGKTNLNTNAPQMKNLWMNDSTALAWRKERHRLVSAADVRK